jgi:CMP-N-acetylneuraminic acid synthetase
MTQILGLITARGGSKGLPGKNLRPLAGKPLMAWTIETARQCPSLGRVIVSTDDANIAEVGRTFGAEVPFLRPAELAQDDSSHLSVVEHALAWLVKQERFEPDYVLLLQPTCPLRTASDIEEAVNLARARQADAVVSVCEVKEHPYLTMSLAADGTLRDFVPHQLSSLRRQDLPKIYALNGAIYLNRPDSLRRHRTFVPPGSCAYVMPRERSLDIDTPWDFHLAELLFKHGHADRAS